VAILMVRAAKGDGTISQDETDQMIETLCSRLGLRSSQAMEYLSSAVRQMADASDADERLRRLAADISRGEKEAAFAMMLDIVMVDGQLDPGEHEAAVSAGKALGFSVEHIYAKLRGARGRTR
jgi:uncharacterized tellurite resistance protein B-like protein